MLISSSQSYKSKLEEDESTFNLDEDTIGSQICELEIVSLTDESEGEIQKLLFTTPLGSPVIPLDRLINLRRVHLEKHHLREFPMELIQLHSLNELYLGYNLLKV